MKSKKSFGIITLIIILHLISNNLGNFQVLNNQRNLSVSNMRDSSSYVEGQVDLEFGIPTKVAEISYNFSENEVLEGIVIEYDFDGENGTIWINAENGTSIWQGYLNYSFYEDIVNVTEQVYSLWANSSTLGNHTLYFNFYFMIDYFTYPHPGEFLAIILLIIFLIAIVTIPLIISTIKKWPKIKQEAKLPRSMERIIEKQIEKDPSVQAIHQINKKFAILSVIAGLIMIVVAINPFFPIFSFIKWMFIILGTFLVIFSIYGFYLYIKKPEWVEKKYEEYSKRKSDKTNNKT